ncbi:MAG: hypothetical protein K0Q89_33 [Thermomicrobiales bacterium]|jgi:hypothetical protein|nr:hypothetical protein [Thermomicrobiales bacterium]
MTYEEVDQFISREADAKQLGELKDLVTRALNARNASLPVGTRVRLTNIRPKVLDGATGVTVYSAKGDRVAVKLDIPQPRFGNPMYLKPQCVEAV